MDTTIRIASADEINFMLDLARQEGWNPGLEDALAFQVADPYGFYIETLNDKPIACISLVEYPNNYAFLGLYIVLPEFRGKGYGKHLWDYVIKRHGHKNIALDGVLAQQDNYARSGFQLAHHNKRWSSERIIEAEAAGIDGRSISFEKIYQYVQQFFPTNPGFVATWIRLPTHQSRVFIENNQVKAFGVIRQCYEGYKIGPLYADNEIYAQKVLLSLHQAISEGPIFWDIPDQNLAGMALAKQYNMKPVFETVRMYTKAPPTLDLSKVYGIATLEIG